MGKSKDPKMTVTSYNLSLHMGVCVGPTKLLRLIVGEKVAWSGKLSAPTAFAVNARELFGGMKKEGGVAGLVTFLNGQDNQFMPRAMAQRFGRIDENDCPAFRGMTSLCFTEGSLWGTTSVVGGDYITATASHAKAKPGSAQPGFYWGTNTPYLKGVWAEIERAPDARDIDDVGLDPALALIPRTGTEIGPATSYDFDLSAETNAATTSAGAGAVGYLISGVSALDTVTVSLRAGGTYQAWSPWGHPAIAGPSTGSVTRFNVIKNGDAGTDATYSTGGPYDGYAAAFDAFENVVLTGGTSYLFYINDNPFSDNSGGLSIRASVTPYADRYDANPAHMIYECLVNDDWGMGAVASAIDVDSFIDASEVLYMEGFGLSMIWTRQTKIEDFVTEVIDHINATIFVSPITGLLTLKLIRGDYDIGTLAEVTPDNAKLSKFQRKAFGEIINEIVVTWTNPDNEQDETVTYQDLGMVAAENGEIISDGRNYYGVRNKDLAFNLAVRDVRQAAYPMATCDAEFDRSLWNVTPGSVVKVTWPEHGVSELVMRVGAVDYGKVGDSKIKCSLVEDVFAYLVAEYDEAPGTAWEDTSTPPAPMDYTRVITLPLYLALAAETALPENPEYPEVIAGVLASSASTDCYGYELLAETTLPDGSTEWESYGSNASLGRADLVADLPAEITSDPVTFGPIIGNTRPGNSVFVFIGGDAVAEEDLEIALASDSATAGAYLLKRGVLDTVPKAWPAGTPCTFVTLSVEIDDPTIRSDGETVDYKLLSKTSLGSLDFDSAPTLSGPLTGRPYYPNRPANVKVDAVGFESLPINYVDASDSGLTYVVVTWNERNRLLEDNQVLAWDDATMTAEAGQTTTVTVLDRVTRAVETTNAALAGTSYNLDKADFGSLVYGIVRVTSERDGFESLTGHEIVVKVKDLTADVTGITADTTFSKADEE